MSTYPPTVIETLPPIRIPPVQDAQIEEKPKKKHGSRKRKSSPCKRCRKSR